jgi:hypothetical protein
MNAYGIICGAAFAGLALACLRTCPASSEGAEKLDNIKASVHEYVLSADRAWALPASIHDRTLVFRSSCAYVDDIGEHGASTGDALFNEKNQPLHWHVTANEACEVIVVDVKFNGPGPDGPIPASAAQRNDGACKPADELTTPVAGISSNSDEVLIDNARVKVTRQTLYPGVPRAKTRREDDQVTIFLDPATYVLSPRNDAEGARAPFGYACRRSGNEIQWFPKNQDVSTLMNVGQVSYRIDVVQIK